MRLALALTALLLTTLPARSEEVLAGLSQTALALTATFTGSEILVYGAVRREAPIPDDASPLHVIVTIEGPPQRLSVWRKGRVSGIWMNVEEVRIARAPSFYAVAATAPLEDILSNTEDLRHSISVPRAIRSFGQLAMAADAPTFVEALIRLRREDGLFIETPNSMQMQRETLFSGTLDLPANLIEGTYRARIFLTRDGEIVDQYETAIEVRMAGLGSWLSALARDQPLPYGLLAVLIAVAAGWSASAAFRALQR